MLLQKFYGGSFVSYTRGSRAYTHMNVVCNRVFIVMPPPLIGGGIKRYFCLTFVCRVHRA